MNKIIGIMLLAIGIALLIFGFQSKGSWDSKMHEVLQGSANNKTVWLLAGGAASAVTGVGLILLGNSRKSK